MTDEQITRGEFNAGMKSLRERLDFHHVASGERLARLEALMTQVDARALAEAEDSGRTNARLDMLEKQQVEDRATAAKRADAQDLKIWGLIIAIIGLLGGLWKALTTGGLR